MKRWLLVVGWLVCCGTVQAEEQGSVEGGLRAWFLGGSNTQELRLEYEEPFAIQDVGVAVGIRHRDEFDDEWRIRGYLLAHALDADMLLQFLGRDRNLPDGTLYGALFVEYANGLNDLTGGYVFGGFVDWPGKWQTVVEYERLVWNTQDDEERVILGLRRLLP